MLKSIWLIYKSWSNCRAATYSQQSYVYQFINLKQVAIHICNTMFISINTLNRVTVCRLYQWGHAVSIYQRDPLLSICWKLNSLISPRKGTPWWTHGASNSNILLIISWTPMTSRNLHWADRTLFFCIANVFIINVSFPLYSHRLTPIILSVINGVHFRI